MTNVRFINTDPVPETDPIRKAAYFRLHKFFNSITEDGHLAKHAAIRVHSWIVAYQSSLTVHKVRRANGRIIFSRGSSSKKAIAALQRLERAKSDYSWSKAWLEMPHPAKQAIFEAADGLTLTYRSDPDFLAIPERFSIIPLIPSAKKIARNNAQRSSTAKPERDRAVVEILIAFKFLNGKTPTAKPASRFIAQLEHLYLPLLPHGFRVLSSKATLQKLVFRARDKN